MSKKAQDPAGDVALKLTGMLLDAIRAIPLNERRQFAADVHRILVTSDDIVCGEFNLSRKGRGKKK